MATYLGSGDQRLAEDVTMEDYGRYFLASDLAREVLTVGAER